MEHSQLHAPSCHPRPGSAHCVTCGDEAVPVVVLALLADDLARVAYDAESFEVDVSLVDAVAPGARLLVHGGVALGPA